MISRAAIGYPGSSGRSNIYETVLHLDPPSLDERIDVIRQHLHRSIEW
jgi:hypothetical protein